MEQWGVRENLAHPHSADEGTEAQRAAGTCPRPPGHQQGPGRPLLPPAAPDPCWLFLGAPSMLSQLFPFSILTRVPWDFLVFLEPVERREPG